MPTTWETEEIVLGEPCPAEQLPTVEEAATGDQACRWLWR
jgi:hypothetical protein